VTFSEAVEEVPEGLVVYKDGEAMDLAADAFAVVDGKVEVTVPVVEQTLEEQSIVYSVKLGDADAVAAEAVVIPANEPPAAPEVTADDENNVIVGIDATMEYSLDNGETWTPYDESAAPDLSGDKTVLVRVAATETVPASEAVTLTFTKNYAKLTSVTATNATTITVVFETAPETAPTADDFKILIDGSEVTPEDINKSVDDVTGKTYTLTVASLANKQGSLSVNGTDATIDNSEFGYDFKAPTISELKVLDDRHFQVTFSEKMDASAAVVGNYSLVKLSENQGNAGYELLDGAGTAAVLSSDKKSVVFTTEDTTGVMVPANYVFKVTGNVLDIKGDATQKVYVGTEVAFTPAADDLTDTTGPALTDATYNSGTGVLALTFDQLIDIGAGKVDFSKISIGGVTLGDYEQIAQVGSTTAYNVTLSSAKKAEVNAVTDALTITLEAGAVQDTAATPNANLLISDFAVSKTTPPVATGATYDESTNRLVISFDQVVKYTPVDLTKVTVTMGGTARTLTGGTMKSTENDSSLDIELNASDASAIETAAGALTSGTISLAAGAVQNASSVANLEQSDVALTYNQDSSAPSITGVDYNTETDLLTVKFSETIDYSGIDATKLSLQDGTTTVALAAANVPGGTSGTEMAFDLSAAGNDITDRLENEERTARGTELDLTKLKLVLASGHGLKDMQNNDLATSTYDTAIAVTVYDFNMPEVSAASAIDAKTIDVTFIDEKGIALDAASANTAANYTIALTSNPSQTIEVTKAVLQPDGKTVRLTLGTAHTFVASYTVTVVNVKDSNNNMVDTAANSATYNSTTTLDETKPVVSTVAANTVAGPNNDNIVVTFSEDVDQASATTLSNYTVEFPVGSQLALNADNATITYAPNAATITLKGINLTNGENVRVTVNNIVDKAGNALDKSTTANYIKTVAAAGDAVAPTISSVSGSTGATEDSITIIFSEALQPSSAQLAANYIFESPTGSVIGVAPKSLTYTYDDKGTAATGDDVSKLVVKYDAGTLTPGGSVTVKSANPNTVKDLAGNNMGTAENVAGTNTDGVAPTISAVKGKTREGDTDQIIITFSENVNATDAATISNFAVESPAGNAIALDGANVDISYDVATRTTTIGLDTDNTDNFSVGDVALKNGDSVKVTVSNVRDLAGNAIAAGSAKNGLVNDAANDTQAKGVTGVAGDHKVLSAHSVQIKFLEELDVTTLDTADFTITDTATSTDYPVTSVSYAADHKTLTLTTSREISTSLATLDVALADGAVIKDRAGNTLAQIDTANGDNQVTLQDFVTGGGTTADLAGNIAKDSDTAATMNSGSGKQLSALFKLATDGTDVVTINSIKFSTNPTTMTADELTNLELYFSDDATVGDADDAKASTTIDTGAATITFSNVNKIVDDSTTVYFYVKGNIADAVTDGDTFSVKFEEFKYNDEINGFTNLTTTATVAGTDVTIDVTAPTIASAVTGDNDGNGKVDRLIITFSEPVNITDGNAGDGLDCITLSDGYTIANADYAATNVTTLTLQVTEEANPDTGATIDPTYVNTGTNKVKDIAGNEMANNETVAGTDGAAPVIVSAVAADANATAGIQAGDTVTITFSEATDKLAINATNINTVLALNNGHSWLDGNDAIGSATWNAEGTELTVTLSTGTSDPTIAVGDTITPATIKDVATTPNTVTGTCDITGAF